MSANNGGGGGNQNPQQQQQQQQQGQQQQSQQQGHAAGGHGTRIQPLVQLGRRGHVPSRHEQNLAEIKAYTNRVLQFDQEGWRYSSAENFFAVYPQK